MNKEEEINNLNEFMKVLKEKMSESPTEVRRKSIFSKSSRKFTVNFRPFNKNSNQELDGSDGGNSDSEEPEKEGNLKNHNTDEIPESSEERGIKIHPAGTRVTDKSKVSELSSKTPKSFQEAQLLLTATEDYLSSGKEEPDLKKVNKAIQDLHVALQADEFDEGEGAIETMTNYLSHFSDAFPNWQPEYKELSKLIPGYFD
jgi:hypothetical protein